MIRQIRDHIVNNEELRILVVDEPGPGGACHAYEIDIDTQDAADEDPLYINFQKGAIAENGTNGVTQEALLAVVIDRLRCFQSGEFRCRENALALTKCEEALMWLHSRTRDRLARGVEGQEKV